MIFLYLFLVVAALRFVLNAQRLYSIKHYRESYMRWLAGDDGNLLEKQPNVVKLIDNAGIHDAVIGIVEPAGLGYVRTGNASVLANFPNRREDAAQATYNIFSQTIGVYRLRMWQTINPLFWLECVIYLPKNAMIFLGLDANSAATKFLQLVWWLAAALLGVFYGIFKSEVDGYIRHLFGAN
jgi:hypothetical protein